MGNPDHHHRLIHSVKDWNDWRASNPEIQPNLSDISLAKAQLVHADLHDANLVNTDLKEADLSGANLEAADLQGAGFDHAILHHANLHRAKLDKATFNGAKLAGAVLREARLRHAVLQEAKDLSEEQLAGTDLDGAALPTELQKEPIRRFGDGLDRIEQASSKLQSLFFALLAVCLYCWLTMIATTDAQLLRKPEWGRYRKSSVRRGDLVSG